MASYPSQPRIPKRLRVRFALFELRFSQIWGSPMLVQNYKADNSENGGVPIIFENSIIADGAKVLGPIIIGETCIVAAGSIITIDLPNNCIGYGVNKYRNREKNYDYIYNKNNVDINEIIDANNLLLERYNER
jgi:serine O-acetyltransferase